MTYSEKIGNNLKTARKLKNLTQSDVAKRLGILQPAYARFESGKFQLSYEQIKEICDYLEITPDFLFGYVDEYGEKIH